MGHRRRQHRHRAPHNPHLDLKRHSERTPRGLADSPQVRREVHALTGSFFVPVLVLDDGSALNEPDEIVAWANTHPAA